MHPEPDVEDPSAVPLLRSSAVAQRLGMPVGTLRVWERRYGLGSRATTTGGHRRYSPADIERLERIRHLAAQGHALASLARLDLEALRHIAATSPPRPAQRSSDRRQPQHLPGVTGTTVAIQRLGLVVVGIDLQPLLANEGDIGGVRWIVTGRFDSLTAWQAGPTDEDGRPSPDAVIVAMPALDAPSLAAVVGTVERLRVPAWALVVGFASTPWLRRAEAAGATLLRGPLQRWQVEAWLRDVVANGASGPGQRGAAPASKGAPIAAEPAAALAAPRYAEAELARFAGLSSTVACECPQHVAELLARLQQFEAYSAGCVDRSPEDRALHRDLQAFAAQARTLFELALERVAAHEGIALTPLA
jgi:DNA-binding transcriptional MerR regulator